mmetsp:Transcript_25999/g.77533  ORF Transcript_25999/g.77533 Transcript_25999/m.77533 type:complete len:200 (-) Transcript_25999:1404-2003(-)
MSSRSASASKPPPEPPLYAADATGDQTALSSFAFSSKSAASASWWSSSQRFTSSRAASTSATSAGSALSATPLSGSVSAAWMEKARCSSLLRASTRSLTARSASLWRSASSTISSISACESRPFSLVTVTLFVLPDAESLAETERMPLASISKLTSICGTPRGAGTMPESSNLPSAWLSLVIARSPSKTWMVTAGWLSE